MLEVGIVGCGLIGRKRAEALGEDRLVACFDVDADAAASLAGEHGAVADPTLERLLERSLDVVIVATPHDRLAAIAAAAAEAGSNVLVEKPAGISSADVDTIAAAAEGAGRLVKVGFNHRFAPAIRRAVETAHSGRFGDVMFARARYGHGGRLGLRAGMAPSSGDLRRRRARRPGNAPDRHLPLAPRPAAAPLGAPANAVLGRAGRGQRGPHARRPLGPLGPVGHRARHVDRVEEPLLARGLLPHRQARRSTACQGSYGPQRLTVHAMKPEMGPPETEVIELSRTTTPRGAAEWQHFSEAVAAGDGDGAPRRPRRRALRLETVRAGV